MKKQLIIALFFPILLSVGGCQESFHYISSQINPWEGQESGNNQQDSSGTSNSGSQMERTKIDELSGTLLAFNGSQILAELEDGSVFTFPVEDASLECRQGMIAGSQVVIIYEGTFDPEHPESLNILKIAAPVESQELRIRTAGGTVSGLTLNTLSIRTANGASLKFSTTGVRQYYSLGIQKGTSVYIHFQGKFHKDNSGKLNTANVKVLDISDLKSIPEPTPTPTPDPALNERDQLKYLTGYITGIHNYTLDILPNGSQKSLEIDLRQITCRFPYGLQAGSRVTVSYTGIINGTDLTEAQILTAVGEDLLRLPSSQQTAAVSGTIQAQTANTVTITTKDGAALVFDISELTNFQSLQLQKQDSVTILFNPAQSTDSALYIAKELQVNPTV